MRKILESKVLKEGACIPILWGEERTTGVITSFSDDYIMALMKKEEAIYQILYNVISPHNIRGKRIGLKRGQVAIEIESVLSHSPNSEAYFVHNYILNNSRT